MSVRLRLIDWTVLILAVLLAATFIVAMVAVLKLSDQQKQFCNLVNSTHADRVARYDHTLEYLRSPAGREHTLLNDYIRKVSLPQSQAEIRQEAKAIPPSCRP